MRWLALVLLVVGCRREPVPQSPLGSASPRPDPWAVTPRTEDPPDLATVHALAEKACPKVARPYLFEIEKGGKVSHILGTRHLGVPLAKLPARVPELVRNAKLAVFETPPGDDDDDSDEPPTTVSLADQLGPDLWAKYRALVGPINAERVEHAG